MAADGGDGNDPATTSAGMQMPGATAGHGSGGLATAPLPRAAPQRVASLVLLTGAVDAAAEPGSVAGSGASAQSQLRRTSPCFRRQQQTSARQQVGAPRRSRQTSVFVPLPLPRIAADGSAHVLVSQVPLLDPPGLDCTTALDS